MSEASFAWYVHTSPSLIPPREVVDSGARQRISIDVSAI
jgi:hypothetical protein